MKPVSSFRSTKAVTLLEILIAMCLVSMAVLAILAVYTSGLKLSAKGEKMVKATEIAQSTLETIRELGYDKIPEPQTTFSGKKGDPQTDEGFPPAPYPGESDYPIQVTAGIKETDLKSVTVRVFYNERNSVVLQTFFSPFQ